MKNLMTYLKNKVFDDNFVILCVLLLGMMMWSQEGKAQVDDHLKGTNMILNPIDSVPMNVQHDQYFIVDSNDDGVVDGGTEFRHVAEHFKFKGGSYTIAEEFKKEGVPFNHDGKVTIIVKKDTPEEHDRKARIKRALELHETP